MKQIIGAVIGAIIFAVLGFFILINYGGNNCDVDGTCDCFCCHGFGVRGYESCGIWGVLLGLMIGGIVGYIGSRLISNLAGGR